MADLKGQIEDFVRFAAGTAGSMKPARHAFTLLEESHAAFGVRGGGFRQPWRAMLWDAVKAFFERRPAPARRGLPTAEDICPYGTLDELSAKKHFLGKDRAEAALLFFEHAQYYGEDIFWMGDAGFTYYLASAIPYTESAESEGDCVFASGIILTLETRLEQSPKALRACRKDALRLLRYLCANWAKFDIGVSEDTVYRDLPERGAHLLAAVEAL